MTSPAARLDVLQETRISYLQGNQYRTRITNTDGNTRILSDGQQCNIIFGTTGNVANGTASEAMRLNWEGKLGIGTTLPGSKLHVVDGNNYAKLGDLHSNSTMSLRMADNSGFPVEVQAYGTELRFNTATTTGATPSVKMNILPNGNVGIGTTSPSSLLTLNKATGEVGILLEGNGTDVAKFKLASAGVNHAVQIGSVSNNEVQFHTANSEKMRLAANGNVGIGTTSPDITGFGYRTLTVVGGTSAGYAGVLELGSPTTNANGQNLGIIAFMDGSTRNAQIDVTRASSTSTSNMHFYTNGGSGIVERMRIDSSGNVGIAWSSPSDFTSVNADNLVVGSGTGSNGITVFSATNAYGQLAFADGTGTNDQYKGLIQYAHPDDSMRLFTANTERMRIFSNGNVNIGVAETGSSAVTGPFVVTHTSSRFLTSSYEESAVSLSAKNGNNNLETLRLAGDSIKFFNGTNAVGSQKMVILNNGNVGIGTTSPSEKLHVNGGNIRISSVNNANHLNIQNNATATSGVFEERIKFLGWNDNENAAITGMGNAYFGSPVNALAFSVSAVEAMRIKHGGNVGIGTASPPAKLSVYAGGADGIQLLDISDANNSGRVFYARTNGGSWCIMNNATNYSIRSGGVPGSTSGTEKIRLTGYSATSWTSGSDETIKENIRSIGNVLDKINDYRCVEYNLIDDETRDKKIGFIAQDWQEDFPQIIEQMEDEKIGMKYTETIPILLKAIQELKADNDSLKTRIETLENN